MKCIDDESPFEIPEGWEWCRLKTISIIQEGPGIRSFQYTTKGVQLLTVTNILEGAVDLQKSQKYISSEEYTNKYLHFQLNKGDIVCACSGGSWGKSAIFDLDNKQIILNTSTLRLRFYGDLGCNGFLYHLTKSSFFKLQLAEQLSGMQPNFGYAHYSKILIPLPPIQEQMRIKSKINELLLPLSKYTHAQDKLDRLNASIKPSLKKAVLQEAIQGKLVPQDPNNEPASVLLERIREEKHRLLKVGKLKKKDITDSVIFKGEDNKYFEKVENGVIYLEEEIPFEIPETWTWVRLNDICEYIQRGKSPKYSEVKKYPVVAQKCNQWSGFSLEKALFIDPNTLPSYGQERFMQHGDLLWNSTGLGTLGRMAIYNESVNPYGVAVADSHVTVIRPIKSFINFEYLYLYFSSNEVQSVIEDKADGSTKQKELATKTIKSYLVPLPPLSEQYRIVAKYHSVASIMSR